MEGIARFIHETTRRMVINNPDVEFHFLFDRNYDEEFIYADNVIPHVLQPPSRHPILWYVWFEHSVRRFLEKNAIDVFYSGDMYLSLSAKTPTLYVSHDLNYIHYPNGLKWSHLKFLNYYFPKYHKRADHIIAVSEFTRQDILKQFDISRDKVSVAYNDVPGGFGPIDELKKKKIQMEVSESCPYFLYVGSLHPRKNLENLLLAFDLFKAEYPGKHKLIIYGRKAFKAESIFRIYKQMKYKADVLFLDNKVYSVQDVLPACEALCYPSLFEGFGIPILEAFYSEVPVVTSNISSMPEVAGGAAELVDPQSFEDIARGMKSVLSQSRRDELIELGRKRKHAFSWEKSAQIIFDKLLEINNDQ